MSYFYTTFIYQPILASLTFIYHYAAFQDLGAAIILLTVAVRIILFPIFYKTAKDQSLMQALQPHIKKIQLDHKDNKEEQAKKLMELYREHSLNPFSGFLLIIVQLPILIALFRVFTKELAVFGNHTLFGLVDLSTQNLAIAFLAAILQYFQSKLALPQTSATSGENNPLASTGKMMVIIAPLMTFLILKNLPAALGIYWTASGLFSIGQQLYINKTVLKKKI